MGGNKIDLNAISTLLSRMGESPAPIIFFDLETTGVDVKRDRIVTMSAVKIFKDKTIEHKSIIVNPSIPIPSGASEVHGITNDMVIGKPFFKNYASGIHSWIDGCVLAGHNVSKYDIPLLRHELYRCGFKIEVLDVIDTMSIEAKCSPRNLGFVYSKYTNKVLEDAHNADADTLASLEVFSSMLDRNFRGKSIVDIMSETNPSVKFLDIDGNFYMENGKPMWNVNPKRGTPIIANDNFIQWYLSKDFSEESKNVLRKIISEL